MLFTLAGDKGDDGESRAGGPRLDGGGDMIAGSKLNVTLCVKRYCGSHWNRCYCCELRAAAA